MKQVLYLVLLIIGCQLSAQELDCNDFKKGRFYIPKENKNGPQERLYIKRFKKRQIEYAENGKIHAILEWLDDCTYRIHFDGRKNKLAKTEQWINDNGGLVVTLSEFEGKCVYYKATLKLKNGGELNDTGKICKE